MLYLLSQDLGDALSHTVRMVTGISQDVISEDHEGCGEHELHCNGRGCGRYVVMGAFKLRGQFCDLKILCIYFFNVKLGLVG